MNRDIFTVIIQNEKTTESFLEHQSLFVDAINDQRVAVCKWNENGTTIDTALPELRSIINDTHLWRAIIVRYHDGDCMSKCKSKPENPYDFSNDDKEFVPTDVPLIRLTQMLGGVPSVCPTVVFDYKNDDEESDKKSDKAKKVHAPADDDYSIHKILRKRKFVYKFDVDEKEVAERKEREKCYGMDMRTPVSILMVSVRRDYNREVDILDRSFSCRTEANSSKFWEKNQYPSICRFLICDYINEGLLQREADEFNLWFSLMILATNVYKSDIISAYKLYRLRTIWDKEKMTDSFQRTVNRLRYADRIIRKDLNEDFSYRSDLSEDKLKLDVDVAVNVSTPEHQIYVNPKDIHVLSKGYDDVRSWEEKCGLIEDDYVTSIKTTERNLDKSAESVRAGSFVDESDDKVLGEKKVLGKYQEEDLQERIDELFSTIVKQQNELPDGNFINEEAYISKKTSVKDYLLRKVQKKDATVLLTTSILLAILTCLFALFFKRSDSEQEALVVFVLIAIFGLVAFLSILIVLIAQKITLNRLIKAFNSIIHKAYSNIFKDTKKYKDYVSNIASHAYGVSILSLSKKRQVNISDKHEMRHAHLKAIAVMLKKLESWTKAYHLDVDFQAELISQHVEINVMIAPIENKMYAFESDMNYPVDVNNSGILLKSPYNFASKIEICREELYDVIKKEEDDVKK